MAFIVTQKKVVFTQFDHLCFAAVSERIAGLTPFSNMMLVGSKNDETDLHSVVAKQLGISRDLAKVNFFFLKKISCQKHFCFADSQLRPPLWLWGAACETGTDKNRQEATRSNQSRQTTLRFDKGRTHAVRITKCVGNNFTKWRISP